MFSVMKSLIVNSWDKRKIFPPAGVSAQCSVWKRLTCQILQHFGMLKLQMGQGGWLLTEHSRLLSLYYKHSTLRCDHIHARARGASSFNLKDKILTSSCNLLIHAFENDWKLDFFFSAFHLRNVFYAWTEMTQSRRVYLRTSAHKRSWLWP